MNLRDAIKAETIKHFKLPEGAEVSKELMAKYMMNTEVKDFSDKILRVHLCDTCKSSASDCDDADVELDDCVSHICKCNKYSS